MLSKLTYVFLILVGIVFAFGVQFFVTTYCKPSNQVRGNLGGSPVVDKNKISEGYTLVSSLDITKFIKSNFSKKEKTIHLIDLHGRSLHSWETPYPVPFAKLRKNGNLLVALINPVNNSPLPVGVTGVIQELDWDGNVVWEYKNPNLHHDFDMLPNGNLIVNVWEPIPQEFASKIPGGVVDTELDGVMYGETFLEIDKEGKVVWTWKDYENLNPEDYPLSPLEARDEWGHANSLRYVEKNPINGDEALLVSMRRMDKALMISKKDGSVLWESPTQMVSHQHDARLLPNGNILVFDNNFFFKPNPTAKYGSRVVEINPKTNEIVWQWNSGAREQANSTRFWSSIGGAAQRLENGNTLILDTTKGHMFEVTPKGELVWDLINPFYVGTTGPFADNMVLWVHRYTPSEIDWPVSLDKPLSQAALACDTLRF